MPLILSNVNRLSKDSVLMKTIDLSDDTILLTGGAGSIGAEIARELGAAGARVIVTDLSADSVERIANQIVKIGGRAEARAMDVRSTASVEATVGALASDGFTLTGLVNAAGILRTGDLESMTDESWEEITDVNVSGTFRTTRAVSRLLKELGRGSIVNLSSVSAFIGSAEGAAYTATKGAVLSFTYGTAGELAPYGIRVNVVCPAWVDGGFTHQALDHSDDPESLVKQAQSLHPLGRMATPGDVASAVAWLMSSHASFITGTPLFVDGGFMIHRGA